MKIVAYCVEYGAKYYGEERFVADDMLSFSSLDIRSSEQPKPVQQLMNSKKEIYYPDWIDSLDVELSGIKNLIKCSAAAVEVIKRDLADEANSGTSSKTQKRINDTAKVNETAVLSTVPSIKASALQIVEIEAARFFIRYDYAEDLALFNPMRPVAWKASSVISRAHCTR